MGGRSSRCSAIALPGGRYVWGSDRLEMDTSGDRYVEKWVRLVERMFARYSTRVVDANICSPLTANARSWDAGSPPRTPVRPLPRRCHTPSGEWVHAPRR